MENQLHSDHNHCILLSPPLGESECVSLPPFHLFPSRVCDDDFVTKKEDEEGEGPSLSFSSLSVLPPPYKPTPPDCLTCGQPIIDAVLLSVGGRRCWHGDCLRCSQCSSSLEGSTSCYVRDDSVFCRTCYHQQFATKCAGCARGIQSTDWVRRARSHVYHIACFGCHQCKRQLSTGEEFALQESKLLCKQHFVELVEGESGITKQKTKRVRTTFADEQLNILQAHFQIDSNPDGADLEKIAQQTGLSKRVTQVWFQNSRARQKKYHGSRGKAAPGTSAARERGESGHSSEGGNSPHSTLSSDDCHGGLFPTSVTTSVEDAFPMHSLHKPPLGMGLSPIHYD